MRSTKAPYLSLEQLQRALDCQRGTHANRNKAILFMSHFCGLRAIELASLKRGHLLNASTGKLNHVIQLTGDMTKGGKPREVYLMDNKARDQLMMHLDASGGDATDPLFKSQKGGHFSPNTMQKLLREIYWYAGIKASSHSGRRSYATRLIESGADIFSVMTLMGHTNIATTQKYLTSNPTRLMMLTSKMQSV